MPVTQVDGCAASLGVDPHDFLLMENVIGEKCFSGMNRVRPRSYQVGEHHIVAALISCEYTANFQRRP